ncbi:MAG: hypothetical protein PHH84_07180 [Oscillospiraceae bacterium]|nr:hypothetical protein [Oscillospiraceae bacterium]MDD4413968.1 hypothetical protein [Oscillospiraceae bacterium]
MPAVITHYQFLLRVSSKLKKAGIGISDHEMAMIGAQGPDIFFFHRVLPWERGESYAPIGSRLHNISPAKLFEAFRSVLNSEQIKYNEMLGYIEGFFCHYALDRSTHPYIYWAQQHLAEDDPSYGKKPVQYHFRIESVLDTMVLRRETGRLIRGYDLMNALPRNSGGRYETVGRLYSSLLFELFNIKLPAEFLAHAPGDMRHALFFMNDKTMLVRRLVFRPVEKLMRRGHFATSLLRPNDTGDWDYANGHHAEWFNPDDKQQKSNDSFFELYDFAANEATDMITEFMASLSNGKSMQDITQDRGFASDLPGVYEEK